jgi:hypothetical protein
MFPTTKLPRHCPLDLLKNVGWRKGSSGMESELLCGDAALQEFEQDV